MHNPLIDLLSVDLQCSGFTIDAIETLLSSHANAARIKGVAQPAQRELSARLEEAAGPVRQRLQLMRLFTVGELLTGEEIQEAFPDLGVAGALELGLIGTHAHLGQDNFSASMSLNPFSPSIPGNEASELNWWIMSDLDDHLRNQVAEPQHVMGVGSATRSLINAVNVEPLDSGLDLGTGCGVVAMHLAQFCRHVIATDISARALRFASMNAQLNQIDNIEFRQGNLFEPVAGELFDVIASNPPFVITPERTELMHYTYRSTSGTGDSLLQQLLTQAPEFLHTNGVLKCLANWESPWGEDGMQRVLTWITQGREKEVSAWVIQRDQQTPLEYAELWLRDGGMRAGNAHYEQLLSAWINDFSVRRVTKVGFGYISVYKNTSAVSAARAEPVYGRLGIDQQFGNVWDHNFAAARSIERLSDKELLTQHLVVSEKVREVREMIPGTDQITAITLSLHTGIERSIHTDHLIAGAVGACDGELSLQQVVEGLAVIFEADHNEVAEHVVAGVRELVWLGMLTPRDD